MITPKKNAMIYFSIIISFLYAWNLLFYQVELISVLGTSLFPILVGLLSFKWTYKTYKVKNGKERYVWLIISLGLFIHVMGNVIWFIGAVLKDVYKAPDISYLFWLVGIWLFLIALIYKIRLISPKNSTNAYLFNSVIFFNVLFTVSIHFLVQPYLVSAESTFQVIVIGFLYPVVDISILFVVTLLYYLVRNSREKTVFLFLMAAFYLQVIGDSITSIMKANKEYFQLLIEPMWVGALLLIGFAGLFAQKMTPEFKGLKDTVDQKESIFPYISMIILNVLTYHSYDWQVNALSIGLGVAFFLIIGRHLLIIEKNRKLMLKYRELAYQDSLTRLPNRGSFNIDLENAIKHAEMNGVTVTLLVIDLDRFKMINDTLGHIVGDRLLMAASAQLRSRLDSQIHIYRLGGDEFVVLLVEATKDQCAKTAQLIIDVFSETFIIDDHEIIITPSIGISSYPMNANDSESLFKAADAAMYVAKGKGRNNYQFYNSDLNNVLSRRMMLERELRKSIDKKELELFYQPKFDVSTRELIGMEALLRWNNKELGFVSPAEFIPVAEETGLIVTIGEWVLREACIQNKKWQDDGFPTLPVSVNVSVQQLKNGNLAKTVEKVLEDTGIHPQYLELEITESIMQDVEESKKILCGLRNLGISISLDDFGTGYSSLHVLKDLPINTLKIDKTFVDHITEENDQSLVKGIIDIAKSLKLEIVAEGIEYEYQVKVLASYGCDYGQGYYFERPIPASEFANLYMKQLENRYPFETEKLA